MDEAVAAFRKAIELDPKAAGYHVSLGTALIAQNKLDQAVAAFRKAIELDPKVASYHVNLGRALSRQNKLDEAIAALRTAIEVDPKFTPAYISLANALLGQNKLDEAIAAYRKGIERVPQDPNLHNILARLLATCSEAKYRDPSQSVVLARKAVELAPMNPDYANTLGVAHYRAGDWKAAIAALEKSTELRKGGNGFDWFFLAMAHWQLGNEDQARKWYDQAVAWMDKNQPNNRELDRFRTEAEELLKVAGK
jgi:superkiller protein 3